MDETSEEKIQIILATSVVSSLITYSTTKQMVTMGSDDSDYAVIMD